MALQPQVNSTEVVQDGDCLEVEFSKTRVKVTNVRDDEALGTGTHSFDMRLTPDGVRPRLFFKVWSLVHELFLNGHGRTFCKVPLPQSGDAWCGGGYVKHEDGSGEVSEYTVQGGDTITLRTPVHGDKECEWDVALIRGAREIAKRKFHEGGLGNFETEMLYALHRTAMLAMVQHLNPRGLGVCVWHVDLDHGRRGDHHGGGIKHEVNYGLQGYNIDGIDRGAARAITTVDFMVLPVGTPLR
ncbi:hypothetical protein HOI83_00475 [Candidatus Uhrbacteria bacterium]|jgi:hypothetical protein|nr:hypothetical protein [Candidatus Uhrbacteria bacterium]